MWLLKVMALQRKNDAADADCHKFVKFNCIGILKTVAEASSTAVNDVARLTWRRLI